MRQATLSLGAAAALTWFFLMPFFRQGEAVQHPLPPGRIYAVAADGDVTKFDLPLAHAGEQYLLVVANLSTDIAPRRVVVTAEQIDRTQLLPLAPTSEMSSQPPRVRITRPPASAPRPARPQRVFWLPVAGGSMRNPASYREIVGRLSGEGRHVRVYVDQEDRVTTSTLDFLVRLFEKEVRPTIYRHLGWPQDVDGDGKLTILMTGWLDRLDGGRVSLGGMVRPADFRTDQEPPYSNRADILYLNSTLRQGRHLETLLAHELAHAVTCSGRREASRWWQDTGDEEAWLNEAIAHVAEDLQSDNRSNLDYRIAQYLAAPGHVPLVVDDYRRAGLWRDAGSRGACYLFLRWCIDRYGIQLLPKLIYSPHRGVENLEAATGEPFDELLRRWGVESFLDARGMGESTRRTVEGGELCRLDSAEPLGDWGLAGPRFETLWSAGDGENEGGRLELNVTGTAAQHVLIAPSRPGPRRITVRAERGAAMQLTLVRLPDEMARLALEVVQDPTGGWRLQLRECCGCEVRLTHVFWQASAVTIARPPHKCLRQDELSEVFDAVVVPADGTLMSRAMAFRRMPRGPVTVCVAGVDTSGYRVAGWAEIDLAKSDLRVALTDKQDSRTN